MVICAVFESLILITYLMKMYPYVLYLLILTLQNLGPILLLFCFYFAFILLLFYLLEQPCNKSDNAIKLVTSC